jgi:hypothetical protein
MNLNKGVVFCWALVVLAGGFMLFGPTPGGGDQEAAVKKAVDGYVRAFAAGKGKVACDSLTRSAREAVVGLSKSVGAADCPSAMEKTREMGGSEVRSIAKKIRVRKVDVDGGRAKVTLRAAGQDSIAELERTDSGWKISSLPKT